MGRKGGGARGFARKKRQAGDADDDIGELGTENAEIGDGDEGGADGAGASPSRPAASDDPGEVAPTPPAKLGSENESSTSEDELENNAAKSETRGQMEQRHKRVHAHVQS
jgi:hypothetical protein